MGTAASRGPPSRQGYNSKVLPDTADYIIMSCSLRLKLLGRPSITGRPLYSMRSVAKSVPHGRPAKPNGGIASPWRRIAAGIGSPTIWQSLSGTDTTLKLHRHMPSPDTTRHPTLLGRTTDQLDFRRYVPPYLRPEPSEDRIYSGFRLVRNRTGPYLPRGPVRGGYSSGCRGASAPPISMARTFASISLRSSSLPESSSFTASRP